MKEFLLALAIVTAFATAKAHAEETVGEKAQATAHDMKRSVKKSAHHAQEAVCAKSDAKCLAEKAKHRANEAGEATGDKAKEIKNDVDHE
jgi:uncharacterized low-complexity protein